MEPEKTGLEAVKAKVKITALAAELGISRSAIAQWKKVPAERIGDVARFTGITPQVLRPDLFEAA